MGRVAALEALLAKGQDNALLRYSLGSEYLKAGDAAAAVAHLEQSVRQDPGYSAAWKILGKAQLALGREHDAARSWQQGIAAARHKGDKQAEKEMQVFLRRISSPPRPG